MRRYFAQLAAIPLLVSASMASAANSPTFPKKLAYEDDFSISPEQLPPGCNLVTSYTDKGRSAKVTCQSKAQWEYGFVVAGSMKAECPADDSATPYVCHIHRQ